VAVVGFPVPSFAGAHHFRCCVAIVLADRFQAFEQIALEFCRFGIEVFTRSEQEARDEGFEDALPPPQKTYKTIHFLPIFVQPGSTQLPLGQCFDPAAGGEPSPAQPKGDGIKQNATKMSRPVNKEELLKASRTKFDDLNAIIQSLTEKDREKQFPEGTMNRNIRDVLGHLHQWHVLPGFCEFQSLRLGHQIDKKGIEVKIIIGMIKHWILPLTLAITGMDC